MGANLIFWMMIGTGIILGVVAVGAAISNLSVLDQEICELESYLESEKWIF